MTHGPYKFSLASKAALYTCAQPLIDLATEGIKYVDFSILEGHRGQAAQHAAFIARPQRSKVDWPHGRHNKQPSEAFDFSPFPQDWRDTTAALARFTFVAGVLHTIAVQQGIEITFGWDWNRNLDPRDEKFLDWGHVQLGPKT
jgi:hypothetical protein